MNGFWMAFITTFIAVLGISGILFLFMRPILKRLFGQALQLILTQAYSKNLWEIASSGRRFTAGKIVEMALRSEQPTAVQRSMGTPKKMPDFERVMFLPAQLAVFPTHETIRIDTKTVIGPRANRPLRLDIPLIVGGWGMGPVLSEAMKLSLAKGAAKEGTATNTGESPMLEEERKEAEKLIYQLCRAPWSFNEDWIRQADMIEIVVGSGATAGTPFEIPGEKLSGIIKREIGMNPGESTRIDSRIPGMDDPEEWPELVSFLREVAGGVPIGVKLIPSHIEKDIESALDAGVDFITIDGAQGGVKESAPILQDDFGLPTIRGLVRAVQFLEENNARHRISLIASGGLYSPGDYLKAMALGADAVALDTVVLLGALHTQVTKVLPWEPISQLIWADGAFADQLDADLAAKHLSNLLKSSVEEMKIAVTCMGKKALREVNRQDLVAIDPESARMTKLPLAYERQHYPSIRSFKKR